MYENGMPWYTGTEHAHNITWMTWRLNTNQSSSLNPVTIRLIHGVFTAPFPHATWIRQVVRFDELICLLLDESLLTCQGFFVATQTNQMPPHKLFNAVVTCYHLSYIFNTIFLINTRNIIIDPYYICTRPLVSQYNRCIICHGMEHKNFTRCFIIYTKKREITSEMPATVLLEVPYRPLPACR